MKKINLPIFIFFGTALIVSTLFVISLEIDSSKVRAGTNDNVYGFAWANVPPVGEKIGLGWISLNSLNCDPDNDGFTENTKYPNCPNDLPVASYGVSIESDGNMTGYAYFEAGDGAVGWIDFDPSPDPSLTNGYPDCSPSTCPSGSPNYSARVDTATGKITGWARACNVFQSGCAGALKPDSERGGWDGWILLGPIVKEGTDYGVRINVLSKEFEGWAWGGDVVGWISFNCNNPETGNVCGQSDYKVYTDFSFNAPPTVQNPHILTEDYCVSEQTGRIVFRWTYSDPNSDPETRYDLKINDVNDVNDPNPEVDITVSDLNNPSPSTNDKSISVIPSYQADKLQYDKHYYWWVRVWDDQGNHSEWVYGGDFWTAKHAYPYVSFDHSPDEPTVEEVVQFTNQSKCYDNSNNEVSCSSYLWQIPASAEFTNGTNQSSQDPQVIFHETGDMPVSLTVTDASGFSCEKPINVGVNAPLPGWIEVPPR